MHRQTFAFALLNCQASHQRNPDEWWHRHGACRMAWVHFWEKSHACIVLPWVFLLMYLDCSLLCGPSCQINLCHPWQMVMWKFHYSLRKMPTHCYVYTSRWRSSLLWKDKIMIKSKCCCPEADQKRGHRDRGKVNILRQQEKNELMQTKLYH